MVMVASPEDPGEDRSILPFKFPETGQEIRVVQVDGNPWLLAADVCAVLGYSNASDAVRSHVDQEDLTRATLAIREGSRTVKRERPLLNESGLYSLILRSNVPGARAFKRWVTSEVLPAIRKTGRFEAAPAPEPPREIAAAAGVLPYRDQAELLVILRPVLPEPYAVATGKVIMARAMGEAPVLDPSETPLYAATFLAEQGHKAKTVAKFQSGFGARVSNRYFKVHGRRPGKVPGPAGSRIDKVVAYTEDDRPLLMQVYAEMADVINMFETGGQTAIGA